MKNKILLASFLAGIMLACNGCFLLVVGVAAGAGAGTYAYVDGELKDSEAVSYENAIRAATAGLKDLNYAIVDKKQDAVNATLTARGDGDKKIEVKLVKASATVTEIHIRIGTFGDEKLSHTVLDAIKKHL